MFLCAQRKQSDFSEVAHKDGSREANTLFNVPLCSAEAIRLLRSCPQGWIHLALITRQVLTHRRASILAAAIQHAQIAVVGREILHGRNLTLAAHCMDAARVRLRP